MNMREVRVAEEIKRLLSDIIQKDLSEKVQFFSIPHVKVSKDLSYAKIYISFFQQDSAKDFDNLERSKKFLRFQLAKKLRARKTPELQFILDDSMKSGSDLVEKINNLEIPEG